VEYVRCAISTRSSDLRSKRAAENGSSTSTRPRARQTCTQFLHEALEIRPPRLLGVNDRLASFGKTPSRAWAHWGRGAGTRNLSFLVTIRRWVATSGYASAAQESCLGLPSACQGRTSSQLGASELAPSLHVHSCALRCRPSTVAGTAQAYVARRWLPPPP